jgi:hypothetical protein
MPNQSGKSLGAFFTPTNTRPCKFGVCDLEQSAKTQGTAGSFSD